VSVSSPRIVTLRGLLDDAMRLTRSRFMTIYPVVVAPLLVVNAAVVVYQVRWMRSTYGGPAEPGAGFSGFGDMMVYLAVALAAGVVFWLGNSIMLAAAVDAVAGRSVSMAACLSLVLRPRFVGTLVVLGVVVLAGSMLCLLPGVFLGVLFGLTVPVMVVEEKFGTAALGRSKDLILHNPQKAFSTHPWVRLFVITVVGGIISYALSMAVQLPFGIASQVLMFRSMAGGAEADAEPSTAWMWLLYPQNILGTLATEAVVLYMCFAVALFYFDLRWRREGGDLEEALDELGAPPAPENEADDAL